MQNTPKQHQATRRLIDMFNLFYDNKKLKSICSFENEKLRVKVTRIFKNDGDFRVSIGKPNYAEKKYVAKSKKLKIEISGLVLKKEFKK